MADTEQSKDIRWYVASTASGRENRVKDAIISRIKSMDLSANILRVIVAEVEVDVLDKETKLPTGKKKMRNLYPGYIFIEMIMSDEAWFMVRNTPGVTGFIGSSGRGAKPFPVPDDEIEHILKRLGIVSEDMYERYQIGNTVRIINGPLTDTEGVIEEFDKTTGVLKITANFFGRPQILEVNFADTEKISD
jgi:transcriptional antiterminator NusG